MKKTIYNNAFTRFTDKEFDEKYALISHAIQLGDTINAKKYRDILKENGIDVTYETGPGAHEWDFWDRYIEKAIEWLPTDDTVEGLGSGNIGDR